MTSACTDLEPLIAERADGSLAPADAARLDAHLAGCAHCRAELDAYAQALGLARLPPVSDAERAALAQLPARVRAELRRERTAAPRWSALVAGLAVAAAVALVVVVQRRLAPPPSGGSAAVVERIAWQEPDPEALLQRVEREHADLAVASDEQLARAERLADAAYAKAVSGE